MSWFSGITDAMQLMRDCTPKPFPERRKGWCRTNTADDRRRRKARARELTRLNMQKKEESR